MNITFRRISLEDYDFLWHLHNEALKSYIESTWGWNEELQKKLFKEDFSTDKGEIISVNDEDAGYIWVIEKENETLLGSIRLLPPFQRKGIGSTLIKDVLRKAEKVVTLRVLRVNPAINLYRRLGFEVFAETDTHYLMRHIRK